ncbi:hypothetical protein JNW88_24895 [Micromonospora sp. ATA32]|nr:hypothetical protein [Micromonospora sp. ATA32]
MIVLVFVGLAVMRLSPRSASAAWVAGRPEPSCRSDRSWLPALRSSWYFLDQRLEEAGAEPHVTLDDGRQRRQHPLLPRSVRQSAHDIGERL